MRESILKFAEEFAWEPVIENEALLARKEKTRLDSSARSDSGSRRARQVIVVGMGGSPLAADLLNAINPALNITVHKDYDLPLIFPLKVSPVERGEGGLNVRGTFSRGVILIAISYSGNTEETLDAFEKAGTRGFARAAIAKGGKLLDRAREEGVAYVQLPDIGIQPRMATGFIIKALAVLMELEGLKKELTALADILKPAAWEEPGRLLAERLSGRIPLIYASTRNRAITYNWKIKFNETAKIPTFSNVFPELNHNEMNAPSSQFYTIILRDPEDHPRVQKRMEALAESYQGEKVPVEIIDLAGRTFLERAFSSLIFADWTALALAESRGMDPIEVPIVEEFKKRIEDNT